MPNILDYLTWRGDLPLANVPLCDVDLLVLARMSYAPFDGVVPEDFSGREVTLKSACKEVLARVAAGKAAFRIDDDADLLKQLMDSPRFASLPLCGYVNRFDENEQEQFSAVTVCLPEGSAIIAFRGTDGTLIGWKEDFNMSLSGAVPAQLDAVNYTRAASAAFLGKLLLAGHSKGGNLAVYAAAFSDKEIQNRIVAVRSFDGPGFDKEALSGDHFNSIMPRTRTILPQSSVIGMLLEHEEDFSIVESRSVSILQHNVYFWEVARSGFLSVEELTNSSRFIDDTLTSWVRDMPDDLREKMIDGVFAVLTASEGRTFSDLLSGRNALAVFKAASGLDDETRQVLSEAFQILKASAKNSLPALIERLKPSFDLFHNKD